MHTSIFDDFAIFVLCDAVTEARNLSQNQQKCNSIQCIHLENTFNLLCERLGGRVNIWFWFLVRSRISDMWSILCRKIVGNKRTECRVFIVTRKTFPLFYKHPEIYFILLAIFVFLRKLWKIYSYQFKVIALNWQNIRHVE